MITDDEIDNVLDLIERGDTFRPVARCGLVIRACYRRGFFDEVASARRAVPVLSPLGRARIGGEG